METWLIVLIAICIILIILSCLTALILMRKWIIISKKVDYLIEDITFKTEQFTPVVNAIIRFINYVDILENLLKQNGDKLTEFLNNNPNVSANIEKIFDKLEKNSKKSTKLNG